MSLVCSDYEVKLSLLAKNGQDKDTQDNSKQKFVVLLSLQLKLLSSVLL